ncbi:MAG: hypothetical protein MI824_20735 [Hyphomicrobiales bacterium]|nr:hypothetical protein [Hyphomicrobiales bacterium]
MGNIVTLGGADSVRRDFDLLQPRKNSRVTVQPATLDDLPAVCELVSEQLPGEVAAYSVVKEVISYNRNNLLLFSRGGRVVGAYAMLMLTPIGLERLLIGELAPLDPDPICLASRMMTPAAIYNWAVVAPRLAIEGILHVSLFLRQPMYRHANLFSRPNTPEGVRLNVSLGSRPLEGAAPGLYRYVRLANRADALKQAA